MGPGHPECPQRLDAIEDRLLLTGVTDALERGEVPLATLAQITRAHSVAHLEHLEALNDRLVADEPAGGPCYAAIDPDTTLCRSTVLAARRAAGAAVAATDAVIAGEFDNAFCAVRPPGHHACHDRAMGFCFINNVAVGVRHAIEVHGLERVAIVDFDVHHGNGTEDIFEGDEHVLMVSTFQHPFYPYSGTESPASNMVNIPLAAGAGSREFRQAVSDDWLPALQEFRPELVLFSAGFDAHAEDDMAMLRFVDSDYAWVTEQLRAVAERDAKGRMVSMLEGGYSLSALGRSAVQHIKVLAGLAG
jgi:acetoin utilization deacetylase AcuC-like enzyme